VVSGVQNWTLLRHDPNLTGRPEDDTVVWQATGSITDPTPNVVIVQSVVAVALTRGDGTKVLVRADPLTRDVPDRPLLHIRADSNKPAVVPGETLPVHVEVKTRSGWGVATDNVYAHAEYESFYDCFAQMAGIKPWDNRPNELPPCNNTSNAFTCFR